MKEVAVLIRTTVSIFLMITIYFLPTGIALIKGRMNTGAVFALNLLLGWTGIGWIVALIWACTKDAAKTHQAIEKRKNK